MRLGGRNRVTIAAASKTIAGNRNRGLRATVSVLGVSLMGASTAIVGDFSVSDLLREAAARAVTIEHRVLARTSIETPAMSGMLKAEEVQPGLLMSGYDITYLKDSGLAVEIEPSLLCTVLLDGSSEPLRLDGQPAVAHKPGRIEVLGFGSRLAGERAWFTGQRARAFGITVKPDFLDRFASTVDNDSLSSLRDFLQPGFRRATLPHLARAVEIANEILDHPYEGNLARLYHESQTLRFLLEIAIALHEQERVGRKIGRLQYERAHNAREILDRRLADPPKALDLAREVGVNLTTLQSNFKLAFGTTIFGYVRVQRLKMGRILMSEHGLRVAEAGRHVGFSNPAAFTAAYRKHFGHPPTADQTRGQPRQH